MSVSRNETDLMEVVNALKEQKPPLRNGFDVLSLVIHWQMRKAGFVFLGCGESNDENVNKVALAPEGWNRSDESYSFRYKHPRSSMTYVIKNLVMGGKLLIHGLGVEDGTIYNVEIKLNDFVNSGVSLDDYDHLFKDFDKLLSTFKVEILNKIFPDGAKEGYEHSASVNRQPQNTNQYNQPHNTDPYNDPLRVPGRAPRQPVSPLMEGGPYFPTYGPPFAIGGNDLNPFQGPPTFGGPIGPTGNLIGPNHPGFGPNVDPYAQGRGRGRGFIPPGARFDPYGPGNLGEPDRDDLPPPGPNYDYFL